LLERVELTAKLGRNMRREKAKLYAVVTGCELPLPVVIAREGGRSSTPRPLWRAAPPLAYWIAGTSRAMTAEY
jgi:hypothetical protein